MSDEKEDEYLNVYKYNAELYPNALNEFATASFRLHSIVPNRMPFCTRAFTKYNEVELKHHLFNSTSYFYHADDIMRGTLVWNAGKFVPQMANTLHNYLFFDDQNKKVSLTLINLKFTTFIRI